MKRLVLPLAVLGLLASCGGQPQPQQLVNLSGNSGASFQTGKFTTSTPWHLKWSLNGTLAGSGGIDLAVIEIDRMADEDAYRNGIKKPMYPFQGVLMGGDQKAGTFRSALTGTFGMYVHSPGPWFIQVVTDP